MDGVGLSAVRGTCRISLERTSETLAKSIVKVPVMRYDGQITASSIILSPEK